MISALLRTFLPLAANPDGDSLKGCVDSSGEEMRAGDMAVLFPGGVDG